MTALYVLDVPENTSVAKVAGEDPTITVNKIGPYFEIIRNSETTRKPVAARM